MYYPNIEIPDGNWLRNALLYWDEISSIVPRRMESELYSSSRTIAELKDEGVYRPFYPDELMNSPYFGDFEKEVINRIKAYFRTVNKKRIENSIGTIGATIHKEKIINYYGIHEDKISYRIMEYLENKGFVSSNDSWIIVDKHLANIYMPILAKYSALTNVDYTAIGTDQIGQIDKIYPIKYSSRQPRPYKTPVINLSLNILPSPSAEVSCNKILHFKRKYREELLAFRKIINDFETQISNSSSAYEFREKIVEFKETVELGTRETVRMLKGFGIKCFLSSLKSVINIKSPTLLTTYAGIAGYKLSDIHPAVTLSAIGIAGIIDVSLNYLAINKSTIEKLSDKGFLYLYYAKRKGIINEFI